MSDALLNGKSREPDYSQAQRQLWRVVERRRLVTREPERQMTAIDGHSWVKQIDKLSRPIRRAKSKQKPEKARFCDWRLHLNIYIAPYLVQ